MREHPDVRISRRLPFRPSGDATRARRLVRPERQEPMRRPRPADFVVLAVVIIFAIFDYHFGWIGSAVLE